MMKQLKIVGEALVASVMALVLAAPDAGAQAKLVDQIKQRGKIQVGMASFIPWAMRNKQGEWVGFEVDVATKMAKDMGVQLELVPTAWDAVIPSLQAAKFDVVIGGLSITPQRKEQVDFTDPYSQSGQSVAANKQLAGKLKFPDDYNQASITFACRRGAAPCKTIADMFPKATARQFDDDAIAFQEVINGGAHAIVTSEPKPTFFVMQNPDTLFKPLDGYLTTSHEGFGLRKGNPEAIAFFNDWIAKNRDWLKERHTYWFKGRTWADSVPQN